MKNILLTGGAGYIGSHVANFLLDKGCKVTIIDNLSTGSRKLVPKKSKFYLCDLENKEKISKIIKKNNFDVVMHIAGVVRVDESIKKPKKYNYINHKKGKIFLNTCIDNNLKSFIFSSTASVYGNSADKKVSENSIRLAMGEPIFDWNKIPLSKNIDHKKISLKIDSIELKKVLH